MVDEMPYREPVSQFRAQWQRFLTTWQNKSNIKTAGELRKHLGITDAEYIEASRGYVLPQAWLERTANELQIDMTYILTGQTSEAAGNITVNKGATGTKINQE